MANLTKQMLTEAGFDARLTWLGTDHIAYDYSTPNLSVDNHMICTVMLGDEMIFLDGTEKFNSLGEYNSRIQGQQMLIEDGENFILTRVPVTAPEFNSENAEYDLSIQDEEIVGSVHKSFSGQQRSDLLYYFHSLQNDRKDDFLNFYLSNGSNNIEVSNIQTSDLTNRDSILEIAYDIRIKNAVSSFGNTIYLDLDIDKELGNMDFKDRKVDYQFDSRKDLLATYKITIPDGLEVSAIPEAYKTSTEAYDLNVSFDKQYQKLIYKNISASRMRGSKPAILKTGTSTFSNSTIFTTSKLPSLKTNSMNRYFYSILFLVIASVSFAQSNKEDNVRELFWGPDDPVKNVMEIPEKWQRESAVVIYKFEDYTYNKFISKMTTTKSVRQRIKLLDQAAVEEFSEFSFTNRFKSSNWIGNLMAGEKHIVGVKVIKPDGSENVINVAEESVEVDGETKLAIANLEIGDIIDYYSYIEDLQPVMGTIEIYDPVEETLAEVYPVMNYRLQLLTDNKFYLNFRSFNGAPELKEIDNNKNSKRLFVLEAQDIAKRDFPNWYYPLVELPSVKFQVYYAVNNKNADYAMAFISEDEDIVKKEVSREEILNLYDTRFRPAGNYGEVEDYLKAHEYASDAKMVQDAYYFMRHYFFHALYRSLPGTGFENFERRVQILLAGLYDH